MSPQPPSPVPLHSSSTSVPTSSSASASASASAPAPATVTLSTGAQQQCLNPLDPRFDALAALSSPFSAVLSALPTAFDRAAMRRSQALDNISQCQSLSEAPFRLLQRQRPRPRQPRTAASNDSGSCNSSNPSLCIAAKPPAGTCRSQPQPVPSLLPRQPTSSPASIPPAITKKRPYPGNGNRLSNIKNTPTSSTRVRHVVQSLMQTAAASSSAKHNLLGQQGCGPLQLLLRAARSPHTRVRVVVRERHAIAGVIIARVVAFDKHVNMVLKQCTWYRYHDDNEDDDDGNEYNNCVPTAVSAGNPIGNRRRSHSRVGRGSTRTMPLMLLRGEHVVVVSLLHH